MILICCHLGWDRRLRDAIRDGILASFCFVILIQRFCHIPSSYFSLFPGRWFAHSGCGTTYQCNIPCCIRRNQQPRLNNHEICHEIHEIVLSLFSSTASSQIEFRILFWNCSSEAWVLSHAPALDLKDCLQHEAFRKYLSSKECIIKKEWIHSAC